MGRAALFFQGRKEPYEEDRCDGGGVSDGRRVRYRRSVSLEPDGVHEMTCPEASCASVECHGWESLSSRYHQASDASLNLWILMPVALVVALIGIVGKVGRS